MGFLNDVLPNDTDGWVPILTRSPRGDLNNFQWFHWPSQEQDINDYVLDLVDEEAFFSPMLYAEPRSKLAAHWARKENVIAVACVYADGDDCPPELLRIKPTVTVRTSGGHWQGYWRINPDDTQGLDLTDWEDMARGVYTVHKDDGMDSGWPLAKKMRLPGTLNKKARYGTPYQVAVDEKWCSDQEPTLAEWRRHYPPVAAAIDPTVQGDEPEPMLPEEACDVITRLNDPDLAELWMNRPGPGEDWSRTFYRCCAILWEAGVNLNESFRVMQHAACNKWERDEREQDMWPQMQRDHARWASTSLVAPEGIDVQDLVGTARIDEEVPTNYLTAPEIKPDVNGLFWQKQTLIREEDPPVEDGTFIDAFVAWAQTRSQQSPWEFNVAGAVALMSATLSRYASIPLSFGDLGLNVYFMVLGRTTQSRKTTSLKLAEEIIWDVTNGDPDQVVNPSDSTPEALSEHLAGKVGASSLLAIDEFQDTLTAAARKGSYTTGLIPFLTKAYDGMIPGVLRRTGTNKYRKSTRHYLSFYATGILNQSAESLTVERIESGFVPRCMIVTDRRTGFQPGAEDVSLRVEQDADAERLQRSTVAAALSGAIRYWEDQHRAYRGEAIVEGEDTRIPLGIDEDAFTRWKQYAFDLTQAAANHPLNPRAMFPTCERLSYSVLKVAALLAMTERRHSVGMRHLLKAIYLAETWVRCTEVLITEVCNNGLARDVRALEKFLSEQPGKSADKATIMARFENRFDDPKRVMEIIKYANGKGTVRVLAEKTLAKTNDRGPRYQYVVRA